MSYKNPILVSGETYHIYNRSLQQTPIFKNAHDCSRFIDIVKYYLQETPPVKFSQYKNNRDKFKLDFNKPIVKIISFVLMPTHFHFELRQEKDHGILKFIQKTCNSFSHFYNLKHRNKGPLFESTFRAVRIESNEQLLHLSRYIHLNPVTSFLVKNPEDYEFSSYGDFLGNKKFSFLDPSLVLKQFKNFSKYQQFVNDQSDYQKQLGEIKQLIIER